MRSAKSGQGARRAAMGLAVGLAVLLAGMAAPAQAADALRAQPGAPPAVRGGGMATDRGGVQGYGSVTDPSRRYDGRQGRGDDGWRGDRGWDRGYGYGGDWRYQHWNYRPYPGGYYYPGYAYPGYAYPGYAVPAPGQWVWNGWNWVWVPAY